MPAVNGTTRHRGPSHSTRRPVGVYRLAYFADSVLKGTNPRDLAIEQPQEFEFVINMKTAQALGLTVSPMLRYQITDSIPVKQDRGG